MKKLAFDCPASEVGRIEKELNELGIQILGYYPLLDSDKCCVWLFRRLVSQSLLDILVQRPGIKLCLC